MHIRKPPKNCVCERFNYKSALMYFRTSIPTLFHGHTSHLYILYHFAHTHTHFPTPERVSRQNRYERSPQCAYTFYTHPVYVCAVRANWRTFRNYRPRVNIQLKHSTGLQMLSVFEKRRSIMARFLVLCRLNSPFDVLECCELRVFGDRCRVCWSRLNEFFFGCFRFYVNFDDDIISLDFRCVDACVLYFYCDCIRTDEFEKIRRRLSSQLNQNLITQNQ